jgi:hypothetical protein
MPTRSRDIDHVAVADDSIEDASAGPAIRVGAARPRPEQG